MDYVREDLKGKNIQKLPGLVKRPKNKQKESLEESCESLIVGTADGREKKNNSIANNKKILVLNVLTKNIFILLFPAYPLATAGVPLRLRVGLPPVENRCHRSTCRTQTKEILSSAISCRVKLLSDLFNAADIINGHS